MKMTRWMLTALASGITVVLAAGVSFAGADSRPATATAPSDPAPVLTAPTCVAVLAPEVLSPLPDNDRKALSAMIDTLLAESLAERTDFVIVDRQVLSKVLAEKAMTASGAARVDAGEVADSLRPFWSAGVLVSSSLRPVDHADANAGEAILIEAVLAQTGQILASEIVPSGKGDEQKSIESLPAKLGPFWDQVGRSLKANRGRQLFEITGQTAGKVPRLQWMEDDFLEAGKARFSRLGGVSILEPRLPLVTAEERLLRVMGPSAAKEGDSSAGLSATPDIRLGAELQEESAIGISYEKTVIKLKLSLQRGGQTVSTTVQGTVGQWERLREEGLMWNNSGRLPFNCCQSPNGNCPYLSPIYPDLSHPAGVQSTVPVVQTKHPRHLHQMPSGRHRRLHRICAPRQSA